ncbi:hypothetical protein Ct61P_07487 [Colletotrichum tofieldiae]|nr:hypothetical protein Ct61P_07487 [Colletotrichum tofieldiae]
MISPVWWLVDPTTMALAAYPTIIYPVTTRIQETPSSSVSSRDRGLILGWQPCSATQVPSFGEEQDSEEGDPGLQFAAPSASITSTPAFALNSAH